MYDAYNNPRAAAYAGEVSETRESESRVGMTTHNATVENNTTNFTFRQSPWQTPRAASYIADPRNRKNSTPAMADPSERDSLFVTPVREPRVTSSDALHQTTPSGSRKKRKIFPPSSPYETFSPSTPIPSTESRPQQQQQQQHQQQQHQQPAPTPSPGIFGAQARGIRNCARPTSVGTNHFQQFPTEEDLLLLRDVPRILIEGHACLTQMISHLAHKHNALEARLVLLERENRAALGAEGRPRRRRRDGSPAAARSPLPRQDRDRQGEKEEERPTSLAAAATHERESEDPAPPPSPLRDDSPDFFPRRGRENPAPPTSPLEDRAPGLGPPRQSRKRRTTSEEEQSPPPPPPLFSPAPLPGQPYGGPLFTQPPRSSGMFRGRFLSRRPSQSGRASSSTHRSPGSSSGRGRGGGGGGGGGGGDGTRSVRISDLLGPEAK